MSEIIDGIYGGFVRIEKPYYDNRGTHEEVYINIKCENAFIGGKILHEFSKIFRWDIPLKLDYNPFNRVWDITPYISVNKGDFKDKNLKELKKLVDELDIEYIEMIKDE